MSVADARDDRMSGAAKAVEGGEAVGELRLAGLARSGIRACARRDTGRSAGRLTPEAARIASGTSETAPAKGDWRFKDPTWHDDPLYRRTMRGYLASSAEVERLAADAGIAWTDAERARFLATVVTVVRAGRASAGDVVGGLRRVGARALRWRAQGAVQAGQPPPSGLAGRARLVRARPRARRGVTGPAARRRG